MQRVRTAQWHRVLLFVLAVGGAACGGPLRYTPRPTQRAPEADATIVADVHRDQSMTNLQIRVEHLAPPDRINAGGTVFVVWARRNNSSQWTRVGILQYNPSSRTGELNGTTPDTQFELMITVENAAAPAQPSTATVVTQNVGAAS